MKSAKFYEYDGCSTCKKALKYLKEKKVEVEKVAIFETPPTVAELKTMLGYYNGEIRKLFNTSGQVYREMGLSERLKDMTDEGALTLLSQHGKLVKRPFILTDKGGAVGFNEGYWKKIL